MYDKSQTLYQNFSLIVFIAVLGLLAHVAKNRTDLRWFLRALVCLVALLEGEFFFFCLGSATYSWAIAATAIATLLILFLPVRQFASWLFTSLDLIITLQVLVPVIRKKTKATEYFLRKKIFQPNSFPHLIALFVYLTATIYVLIDLEPQRSILHGLHLANAPISEQLLPYSGIALILISLCGIGIYVSRSFKEALQRLGWVSPTKAQIGLGLFLILACFFYNALWIIYTHNWGREDLATNLSFYNSNTFTMAGGFVPSVILALLATACAGIGEETLFRGALQPVFGILPAALLHGLLYGLFVHSFVFALQVAIWSALMGLVKRYTNTSTTMIGHAGFNIVTTALFVFNP